MGKLVLKTAAVTVSLLIGFALILFGIVSLASPAAMMAFADSLDMSGAGAYYSVAVYDRSGKISDLAAAVERSYEVGHYADAADYGEKLLGDAGFSDYCVERDADAAGNIGVHSSYEQYAAGIVSSAQYFVGKKESALQTAFDALGQTCPDMNAVSYLVPAAMGNKDVEFCREILARLENLTVENVGEQENLQKLIIDLQVFCAQ